VLLAAPRHEAVYDFGGFDPRLYARCATTRRAHRRWPGAWRRCCRRPAAGSRSGEGGLDHGIWVPLRTVFPDADIPVLPLAWPPNWTPAQLFALGEALAPLADEGVLIVGSGSITHNMQERTIDSCGST
jgi:4,5-DOPA dioxygenase extradiol